MNRCRSVFGVDKMRCNNCLWFPMKEENNPNTCESLVCPNCGHTHLEGIVEPFIRQIYMSYIIDEEKESMMSEEGMNNWLNNREHMLSDNIYDTLQ